MRPEALTTKQLDMPNPIAGRTQDLLSDGHNIGSSPNTADKHLPQLVIDMDSQFPTGAMLGRGIAHNNNARYSERIDPLPSSELKEVTDSIFNRVDKDRDGYLTKTELAEALQDKSYRGQEAQAIAALYHSVDKIQVLSNDEWGPENDGITRNDMVVFDGLEAKRRADTSSLGDVDSWTHTQFHKFDTDHDNKLSSNEINFGLHKKDLSPDDRRMLTYLQHNYEQIANAHNDPNEWFFFPKQISREDIRAQQHSIGESTDGVMGRTFAMQSPEISRSLFADPNHPERSITMDAIKQGIAGTDCSFLASLAALTKSDPQSIVRMIKDNHNGTYTVTFPGDWDHPVIINAPTDAELGTFNAGSRSGIWASVLEKAYGRYLRTYEHRTALTDVEGGGGFAEDSLRLLTNRSFKAELIPSKTGSSVEGILIDNFKDGKGKPLTVATPQTEPGKENTEAGFPRGHAYTVTGIKPDGKGGHLIKIRNPWGQENRTTGGTIDITLAQFMANFQWITHEK